MSGFVICPHDKQVSYRCSSFLSLLSYLWTIIFPSKNWSEFIKFLQNYILRNFTWDYIEFISYLGEACHHFDVNSFPPRTCNVSIYSAQHFKRIFVLFGKNLKLTEEF